MENVGRYDAGLALCLQNAGLRCLVLGLENTSLRAIIQGLHDMDLAGLV